MRREKLIIELEIDVDDGEMADDVADSYDVVDDILDDGILQDAINNHESDAPSMTVVSAIVKWADT